MEQRGAAAAAELLTRYRALAREAIGRFGGAEIKTEGDSFYVVFDSVSNAVRCGLAITTAARTEADKPIRVGVGIHAGETVEADGGFVGSPVNIAARICAQAGPGEDLVSETVRALTTTVLPVQLNSRGRRQLKGIAEPIDLFAAVEAADGVTARPSRGRRRLSRRARAGLAGARRCWWSLSRVSPGLCRSRRPGLPSGPWTIGVHMPISGDLASDGIAVRNAVQLAVDHANEAGGVEGVELTAKAHDTGGDEGEDPARGAAAANRMAGSPRTIAAVCPFQSPVAGSTIPITNRAGLLECSPSNSHPGLTKPGHGALELRAAHPERINYVRLSPTSDVQARALAAFVTHDLDAESALVIADPDWQAEATDSQRPSPHLVDRSLRQSSRPARARPPPSDRWTTCSGVGTPSCSQAIPTPALRRFAGPCARRGTNQPPSSAGTGFSKARARMQARTCTGQARLQPEPMSRLPRSRRRERTSSMPI